MDQVREFVHEMRLRPQIALPKHWFGFKKRLTNTTPEGWREAIIVERDSVTDSVDRTNFERILKVVDIAEECGATNLAFRTMMKQGMSGSSFEKYLVLDEIWFPKKNIMMMSKFQQRLKEIF